MWSTVSNGNSIKYSVSKSTKPPDATANKEIIEGKVIGIVDGDTFDLLDYPNTTIRI